MQKNCVNHENDNTEEVHSLLQKVQYTQIGDITVCIQRITSTELQPIPILVAAPSIQINFVLKGQRQYEPLDGFGPGNQLQAGYHSLGYYKAMNGNLWFSTEDDNLTVDVSFPASYLQTAFQDDLSLLGNLEKAIVKNQSALFGNQTFPLTIEQKTVLLTMLACSLEGPIKNLFLDGKLRELLALQVNQFQANEGDPATDFTQDDLDRFNTIRDVLLQSLDQAPSIEELARLVGFNRTKLMSGFKNLFGSTIYCYLADARMERAKELMLANQYLKIVEVARQVGFKNANNFSTAFKKKFGYSPTTLR